jgi:hypothetical protein
MDLAAGLISSLAISAWCAWEVWKGLRSGEIEWEDEVRTSIYPRDTKPKSFWGMIVFLSLTSAVCLWMAVRLILEG